MEDQDLKRLLQQNLELGKENNHMLRKMRRGARWSMIFNVIWLLSIIGGSGFVYYYFVQPYMAQIQEAYRNGKDFQTQVQDFFNKLPSNQRP